MNAKENKNKTTIKRAWLPNDKTDLMRGYFKIMSGNIHQNRVRCNWDSI